jgi:hypothetical protein
VSRGKKETQRFLIFQVSRDKGRLDIFWSRDDTVEESAILPYPPDRDPKPRGLRALEATANYKPTQDLRLFSLFI